jgi:hypothetical protein
MRKACWLDIKDPGNAMLIAAYVDDVCASSTFSAALSAPDELTITVTYIPTPPPLRFYPSPMAPPKPGACPQDPTQELLSLLAIPLTALPPEELTVKLVHPAVDIPAERTVVDLKHPLNTSSNADDAMGRVTAALDRASADAQSRLGPGYWTTLGWFGPGRWPDSSLGCPVSGQRYDPGTFLGFIVVFRAGGQPSAMEYHVTEHLLRFCGSTAT